MDSRLYESIMDYGDVKGIILASGSASQRCVIQTTTDASHPQTRKAVQPLNPR